MAISVEGAKIVAIDIRRDKEDGQLKLSGSYELVSTTGVVLAKQSFNGYDSIKVAESAETKKALNEFFASLAKDLNGTLGLG